MIPCKDCITMPICKQIENQSLTHFKSNLATKCGLFRSWWFEHESTLLVEQQINTKVMKCFNIKFDRQDYGYKNKSA